MSVQRAFATLAVRDLDEARAFYSSLLGLVPRFVSDWFVHLVDPANEAIELGLLHKEHELMPRAARDGNGGMLTFVIDDVDATTEQARSLGGYVLDGPEDLFYGQRRALVQAPDGTLLDLSSACDPDPVWMARVEPMDGGGHRERPADDD